MAYEAVIGLECHVQLATTSKMFCGCPTAFGAPANSQVCPVCLGLPGALPVVNRAAIGIAMRLGLALGCEVRAESEFARKHYFYPDMPKNYQISQYDRPLCAGGALAIVGDGVERSIPLIRVHLEEDTGKSFHPERSHDRRVSRVDFNRAGVPLLELVTEPALRSGAESAAFLGALRRLVRWLGISDADMEKGQLRCDANVSIRPVGADALGVKTELKNLNSIRAVERGVVAEIARQTNELEAGRAIVPATLLYDADHDKLAVMRTKESAPDYRYFPEPDLAPVTIAPGTRDAARAALPELPEAGTRRLMAAWGLPAYDAQVLTETRDVMEYFEALAGEAGGKLASNWVMTEVLRVLKEREWPLARFAGRVPAARLAGLLARVREQTLPGPLAKRVFAWMVDEDGDVATVLDRHEVRAQSSEDDLLPLVRAVLDEHPGPVRQVLAGKTQTLGFLVGQVMKKSGGQAVPQTVESLLKTELAKRG